MKRAFYVVAAIVLLIWLSAAMHRPEQVGSNPSPAPIATRTIVKVVRHPLAAIPVRTPPQDNVGVVPSNDATPDQSSGNQVDSQSVDSGAQSSDGGSGLSTFDNEDDAQASCPDDTVVWLNLNSGIYHYQGERWYGNTENGAYVCEQDAIADGDRASENGQ